MKAQKAICKAYVNTPEGQIHYLSAGEGEVLVLLHCTCDAASMWEAVLPVFAGMGYRAVAFDIPGQGSSDPPPREPTGPEYASRINEACQLLGIDRYSVLGHHFGATVAAWIAAEYPQNVKKSIFIGFPLLDEEWYAFLREAKPRFFDRNGDEIVRFLKRRGELSDGGLWHGIYHDMVLPKSPKSIFDSHMIQRVMIAFLQAGTHWYYAYRLMGKTDHIELGKRIKSPVLLLCPSRDPFPVPKWQEEARISSTFPKWTLLKVEGGEDFADEDPLEFGRVVSEFLRS